MTTSERYLFAIIILVVLLCGSVVTNIFQHYHFRETTKMMDTVTVTKYVTRADTAPKVRGEEVTGHVKVSEILRHEAEVVSRNGEKLNTMGYADVKDTATCLTAQQAEEAAPDSLGISLPVVQKNYGDSTYTAYVSGIRYGDLPRLDSIRIRERVVCQTITSKVKGKHFHIGLTAGCGLGLSSRQVEPHVGVGITCSLFSF